MVEVVGPIETGKNDRLHHLKDANSWKTYVRALERCDEWFLNEGYGLLVLGESCSYVHTIEVGGKIARRKSWARLKPLDRTILLGLQDSEDGTWGLLGSLNGAGQVQGIFNHSSQGDSRQVLRRIRGAVERVINASEEQFPDVAVKVLERIYQENGFNCGTATRLLALARPDRMVSVNNRSRRGLAKAFDLSPATLGEPRNYARLLERIYEKQWYGSQPGRKKQDRRLWDMRAALLDSFVYQPR